MIIDTSVLVDIDQGRNTDRLGKLHGSSYSISAATLMEISTGRYVNDIADSEFQKIFDNLEIISVDEEVADKSGQIMSELMRKGERIEINDIYIAATCLIHDEPILTANKDHFERVDDLEVVDWEKL